MLLRNQRSCLEIGLLTSFFLFGPILESKGSTLNKNLSQLAPIQIARKNISTRRLPRLSRVQLASSKQSIAQAIQNPSSRPGASSQSKKSKADISGIVTEFESGDTVGDAHVTLTKIDDTSKTYEVNTDEDGNFAFTDIPSGNWKITITADKMLSDSQTVTVGPGEAKSLNVTLESAETVDIIKITGKRTLVHPEITRNTTHVPKKILYQYKSGNELKSVIETAPGILPDSYGNVITRGQANAVNYQLDGVVLPQGANLLQQVQFASPRSLKSIDVALGGYEAQDGGGPLGAVVRMRSLPLDPKPKLDLGVQMGGPLAGNIIFYSSGAFSQDKKSPLNKLRFEASGASLFTSLGLSPPVKNFIRNGRIELNYLGRLEYLASKRDKFKLTALVNEAFSQVPTSGASAQFGFRQRQHDRQDLLIATWQRKGRKYFDKLNLHLINGFYSETFKSTNAFNPFPIINGEEGAINSVSPTASRFNYVFSAQGDISKRIFRTHDLKAGFLSNIRPVRTSLSAFYYNANPRLTLETQLDPDTPVIPYAAPISPFTGTTVGPLLQGDIGKYKGFQYLQSAYIQDKWIPRTKYLKRFVLDAGARFDLYHGVFGNTMKVAEAIASIPDAGLFSLEPFKKQSVTDAQVSGRFAGSYLLSKKTVVTGSFANIFQPPPVDIFVTAPEVGEGPVNGIFNGTIRPLRATRGILVDVGVDQQIGPRFITRNHLYYKKLSNPGDSGVVVNTPLYNRLSLSDFESYGVENRMELRTDRNGYGFYGFATNTIQVTFLRGSKGITGGIYEIEEEPITRRFPDHDRRYALTAALGYRARNNLWALVDINVFTGLPDARSVAIFGTHPARTPVQTLLGLSAGYKTPKRLKDRHRYMPSSVDVRVQNMLNQRIPVNLGSPFQGTRFSLPLRVLAGVNWEV